MYSGKTTIGFVISDSNYLQHLLHYIRHSDYAQYFQIKAFTRMPDQVLLSECNILLLGEEFASSRDELIGMLDRQCLVFCLSGLQSARLETGEVFKYQPLHKMFREILDMYLAKDSRYMTTIDHTKHCEIITVFSLAGGAGKTTVATSLAHFISQTHEKVLYLNLEDIPNPQLAVEACTIPSLSEFLYHLEKQSVDALYWMGRQHPFHHFYCLQPQVQFRELQELTAEQLDGLLASLRTSGVFDYVIIDTSSQLTPFSFHLLNQSDRICWLLTDEISHLSKMESLLSFAKKTDWTEEWSWLGKCNFVLNKYLGYFIHSTLQDTYQLSACLPYVADLQEVNGLSKPEKNPAFYEALESLFEERFAKRPALFIHGR